MIVVDAMVLNYALINHPRFSDEVERLRAVDAAWCGPPLWRSEQRNVLMKYVRADSPSIPRTDIDLKAAQAYMRTAEAWMQTMEVVHSETVLHLAHTSGCSTYDCEYVALAHALDVSLVTYDRTVLAAFADTALAPTDFVA
jgi:predicted nucleic acid-binding protein